MDFTVHIFGKDKQGRSVAAHVKGYHPTFCVKFDPSVSNDVNYADLSEMLSKLLVKWEKVGSVFNKVADYSEHLKLVSEPVVFRKDCWGFDFGRKVPFFRFAFRSQEAYNLAISHFKACQKNTMTEEEMQEFVDEYYSMVDETGGYLRDEQNAFVAGTASNTGIPEKALKFMVRLEKAKLPLAFAKGKLFEVIDPILRFAHLKNLKMAGWMRTDDYVNNVGNAKSTTCDIEVRTSYQNLQPMDCDDVNPHLKEMSFDIEAYSHNDLFPDPLDPKNVCYQIGITLKHYADKGFDRLLLHCRTPADLRGNNSGYCNDMSDISTCLRSSKPVKSCDKKECVDGHDVYMVKTTVKRYETEKDLLLAFSDIIVREDPDLIYAYNSDIFDWNYLMVRAKVVMKDDPDSHVNFRRMSRMKSHLCECKEAKFASSAYGDNKYMRADIVGRLNIDLMIWVQRNMPADRYPSYSLDTVAEKEIGEQKRDVDAKDIFRAFRSGDPEQLTTIGDYCCQDTMLVQKLVNKLDVLTQMFEMANICDTPPMYLLQKGQQIKCFSQLSKQALEKGFLIPLAKDRDEASFKGAIVLDPIIGKYDSPVSVLDFASLYPSIQVAYKVCYTTIVLDPQLHAHILSLKRNGRPLIVKGVEFDVIEWDEDILVYHNKETNCRKEYASIDDAKGVQPKKTIQINIERNDDTETVTWRMEKKHHAYTFAQVESSLIPDLQTRLKKSRKAVKAMMAPIEHSKDPDDVLRYRVLNGRQLAIKVSMNSLYGFTSAFMMNLRALSAAVTAMGRQMIEKTKYFLENDFEKIAKTTLWTAADELTFFAPDGKEILGRAEGDEWVFAFRGQELCRTRKGTWPQAMDGKPWIKKFPTAVEGKPWANHDLSIRVVAGDTDSCFANFPRSSLQEAISLCHKAAQLLTDVVFDRAPIEMEYEKTYFPLYIQKKKNYIGLKYEMDDVRWKIDYKGNAIKRRNYCDYVKEVFWNVIYPALGVEKYIKPDGSKDFRKVEWEFSERPRKAIESLEHSLGKLLENKVSLDDFVISASIKSNYKGPECNTCLGRGKTSYCAQHPRDKECSSCRCTTCGGRGVIVNLPHIQLAKRMKERDEGSAPISGQRFGYIIVNDPARKSELWARSEDPKYAKENNLLPDYLFYLDQQIRKPLTKFLTLLDKQTETDAVFAKIQRQLFQQLKKERSRLEFESRARYFGRFRNIDNDDICNINENGKRTLAPVTPLKAPKKQAMSRKDRKEQTAKQHVDIMSMFKRPKAPTSPARKT